MRQTTLCYIENPRGEYLMLHRVKKKNDANHDKWIGIGGKFEDGESPEECVLREVREETGLTLTDYRYRGLVTFVSDAWETEYMHLFAATGFEGALREALHRAKFSEDSACLALLASILDSLFSSQCHWPTVRPSEGHALPDRL